MLPQLAPSDVAPSSNMSSLVQPAQSRPQPLGDSICIERRLLLLVINEQVADAGLGRIGLPRDLCLGFCSTASVEDPKV